jgi:hypothetical protein
MAIDVLEALRPRAGESRRAEYEKLDASNTEWHERLVADKKGVTPVARISYTGTGLLDLSTLEAALTRIRTREQ